MRSDQLPGVDERLLAERNWKVGVFRYALIRAPKETLIFGGCGVACGGGRVFGSPCVVLSCL